MYTYRALAETQLLMRWALCQWVPWSLVLFVLARFANLQNRDLLSKNGAALSPSLLRVPNLIYRFFKHFYTSVPLFTVKFHVSVEFLCWKVGGLHRFTTISLNLCCVEVFGACAARTVQASPVGPPHPFYSSYMVYRGFIQYNPLLH